MGHYTTFYCSRLYKVGDYYFSELYRVGHCYVLLKRTVQGGAVLHVTVVNCTGPVGRYGMLLQLTVQGRWDATACYCS